MRGEKLRELFQGEIASWRRLAWEIDEELDERFEVTYSFPRGATAEEIAEAEVAVGQTFPLTLKVLLQVSDGFFLEIRPSSELESAGYELGIFMESCKDYALFAEQRKLHQLRTHKRGSSQGVFLPVFNLPTGDSWGFVVTEEDSSQTPPLVSFESYLSDPESCDLDVSPEALALVLEAERGWVCNDLEGVYGISLGCS